MRVGIDAYLMHGGLDYRAAGVSTYIKQLLVHLPVAAPHDEFVAFHGSDAPSIPRVSSVVSRLPTVRAPVRIVWEQIALPLEARARDLDVVHGMVNVIPLVGSTPAVVTAHDLSFLRFPDRFHRAKATYLRWAVRASVRRARAVIAVSEHTKRDVVDLLGVPPEQVAVIYSGKDASFKPMPQEELTGIRARYGGRPIILHVGTLEPRKNIDVLLRAFARARSAEDLPHVLSLVGARGWMYEALFRLTAELGLVEHVDFVDYVPPDQLPLWYNASDLFIYPSAYEGFGLPVLEAMACGTPTITTAGSGVGELAGTACVTVEPGSVEALEAAMTEVLGGASLRQDLSQAGLTRAACFSWERTAAETARVYRRVSGGSG